MKVGRIRRVAATLVRLWVPAVPAAASHVVQMVHPMPGLDLVADAATPIAVGISAGLANHLDHGGPRHRPRNVQVVRELQDEVEVVKRQLKQQSQELAALRREFDGMRAARRERALPEQVQRREVRQARWIGSGARPGATVAGHRKV
ncbi:MAG: hypothetical protein ACYDGR_00620 [Candidatus Dormibacteria bacterium]